MLLFVINTITILINHPHHHYQYFTAPIMNISLVQYYLTNCIH